MNQEPEFITKIADQIRESADVIARKAVVDALKLGQVHPRRTRVYLAGPMRGKPELNFPAFFEAESSLHALGFDVWNPARADVVATKRGEGHEQKDIVRRDLNALLHVDMIALLQDWHISNGASAEYSVARWLGIPAMYQTTDLGWTPASPIDHVNTPWATEPAVASTEDAPINIDAREVVGVR